MKNTTLCYLEKNKCYLMMHRTKKENDENKDKWIGIGGKLENGESPFDCARREIYEETSIIVNKLSYRGIVTFVSDIYGTEYMHLFISDSFDGEPVHDCDEGILEWVPVNKVTDLPIWEGDKIFLSLLKTDTPFFFSSRLYTAES